MKQTDLWRLGKPPELSEPNCFELLVKSITAFVTLLTSRFLELGPTSATLHTITIEGLALVQWLVLRRVLPDQHVLDRRIIASYGRIAPLVTMSCHLLLRRRQPRRSTARAVWSVGT